VEVRRTARQQEVVLIGLFGKEDGRAKKDEKYFLKNTLFYSYGIWVVSVPTSSEP
jgi:hypothetical protein